MSSSTLAAGLRYLRCKLAAHERSEESDEQLLFAFTSRRDDGAFAVLVRRHGPMVLHVCRRVLGHEQDAEDAFQATFLVLAQSSAALRNKAKLASFLHGIAYRTAMKAKQTAARRRKRECSLGGRRRSSSPVDPADELSWREVRMLLDEEIARLPEIYRIVFVTCCLENLSQAEAARCLGLKERTVSNRLAGARKRLGQRLAQRGVELTAVLAATSLATPPASAVPIGLMASTIQAALAMTAGEKWAGIVSASVAELVKGMSGALMAGKGKMAIVLMLAVGVLTVATSGSLVSWYGRASRPLAATSQPPAARADNKPKNASPQPDSIKTLEIHGRVLDPGGKPKMGAKLQLLYEDMRIVELGVTVADGRFSVAVPKETSNRYLIARTDDAGFDIRWTGNLKAGNPVVMRLVKDQPIRGRVVNTEGKPVVGVRVTANDVNFYGNNSLDSFLNHWKNRRANDEPLYGDLQLRNTRGALSASTTDAEGRFLLRGLGVERFVSLRLSGAGIANAEVWIVTRPGFDRKSFQKEMLKNGSKTQMESKGRGWQLDGPDVTIIAESEKIIRGRVKDSATSKGRPDVLVLLTRGEGDNLLWPIVEARTDAQGRFEIHGARKAKRYMLEVGADTAAGFMSRQVWADDTPGYQPITADIAVQKGMLVTGKMIDGATGKPIRGHVVMAALVDNPFVKDFPAFSSSAWLPFQQTGADGTFRLVTIPGPVLLMGQPDDVMSWRRFKPLVPDPKYPKYFREEAGNFVAYYNPGGSISPVQGCFCKVLNIKPDVEVVKQDIVLERAPVLTVRIQDADGKPLRGVWVGGSTPQNWYSPPAVHSKEADCAVYQIEPGKSRSLVFFHPERKLAGALTLNGDEKAPVVVKLGPPGSIKGRLLDEAGKPLAGVEVHPNYRPQTAVKVYNALHGGVKQVVTSADGGFAFDDVIPEQRLDLSFRHGKRKFEWAVKPADPTIQVKPGECRDLGAIKLKPIPEKAGE